MCRNARVINIHVNTLCASFRRVIDRCEKQHQSKRACDSVISGCVLPFKQCQCIQTRLKSFKIKHKREFKYFVYMVAYIAYTNIEPNQFYA